MSAVRVVVAGRNATPVRDLVEQAGLRVVAEAETQERAAALAHEKDASVIVHAGAPETACDPDVPTVVIGEDADLMSGASVGAFAVLPIGCNDAHLRAAVDLAVARAHELSDARDRASDLTDQLESRKLIERAKGILMVRLGLGEAEAYRRIQKASQEENRKMREIAEGIIQTEKIMGAADSG